MRFNDNRLIAYGTIAGAILTAAGMIVAMIVFCVFLRADATVSKTSVADHEQRLRIVESDIAQVKADVREVKNNVAWIRLLLDPAARLPDQDRGRTAKVGP